VHNLQIPVHNLKINPNVLGVEGSMGLNFANKATNNRRASIVHAQQIKILVIAMIIPIGI
ncbi:2170_t:CDS:1, partial [Gigaspora rosea]